MPYPALSRHNAEAIARAIRDELQDSDSPITDIATDETECHVEMRPGPDYDRFSIERSSDRARKKFLPDLKDSDLKHVDQGTALEAEMAAPIHSVLSELETGIIQDPDFWRYLALFPFRWYLIAREPELKAQDFGGESRSTRQDGTQRISGTDLKHQLIFRTFLWGKAAYDQNDQLGKPSNAYRRTTVIDKSKTSVIDVWHSHIVRVQMGHISEIPHAFVDTVAGPPSLSTDEARELEKLTTRMKHTVLLDVYEYPLASKLLGEQVPFAIELAAKK